jgi:hypothetical protein
MGNAGGKKPPLSVEAGVTNILKQINGINDEKNGRLFDYNGNEMNW